MGVVRECFLEEAGRSLQCQPHIVGAEVQEQCSEETSRNLQGKEDMAYLRELQRVWQGCNAIIYRREPGT